jgi:hypothetical protein
MEGGKKLIELALSYAIITIMIFSRVEAKSVYVISNTGYNEHYTGIIYAYAIDGNNLNYQTRYESKLPLPISLAIDARTGFMFVTHEISNNIEIVDAKLMEYIKAVTIPGGTNLAGVVVESGKILGNRWVIWSILITVNMRLFEVIFIDILDGIRYNIKR